VFDETVFPFAHTGVPSTTPSSHDTPLRSDQFVDAAYTPLLLANHGAGSGHGARLELLDEEPTTPRADRDASLHVDLHAHAESDRTGAASSHGLASPPAPGSVGRSPEAASSPGSASSTSAMDTAPSPPPPTAGTSSPAPRMTTRLQRGIRKEKV
jgi:hypothetical protein